VNLSGDAPKFKVIKTLLIQKPINELKGNLYPALRRYRRELLKHVDKYGRPDLYAAERFMTRGIKGATIEMVSMMLAIDANCLRVETRLWPAVSWKSQVKRYYDLDGLYFILKQYKVPPHILDSALIGVYTAFSIQGIKPFSTFTTKQMIHLIEALICEFIPKAKIRRRKL
jgi:hypothetical protein